MTHFQVLTSYLQYTLNASSAYLRRRRWCRDWASVASSCRAALLGCSKSAGRLKSYWLGWPPSYHPLLHMERQDWLSRWEDEQLSKWWFGTTCKLFFFFKQNKWSAETQQTVITSLEILRLHQFCCQQTKISKNWWMTQTGLTERTVIF